MAAIGALDKARRPEHQPEDQSLPLPPPRPPPRRQIAAAPGITETGQCSPSISWELGAIARHAHLRRRSKSFSTLQHSRQTSHTSSQSLSPTSTRTSTASIHLETPRLVAGAFEWGVGSCATDAMDNSTAQPFDAMGNRSRAETLASYILPDRTRSRGALSQEQQPPPPHQKFGHTHTRSLSRHKRELAFTAPDGHGHLSLAPPRLPATNETASIPPYTPHLADNFTTDIHPGLRRGGQAPPGHVDMALPTSSGQPIAGTVFPPMPRAGSSLRRTKSSAGRPERKVEPKPPLPLQASSGLLSPAGSPRKPSHAHKAAPHRVPQHEPSQVLRSGPSVLPKPEATQATRPSIQIEGSLVSITCAAEMAVRRRVRSAPKSPSAEGTLVIPSIEKHRRSSSLGSEVLLSCRPLHPPRTTSTGMSASKGPPPLKAGKFVKTSPTTFPAPMPFAIPTRAPPPPPIVVPLVATKRIRSPPPPRQSSPPPPPPPTTALHKFSSPTRPIPAPPLPAAPTAQPEPASYPAKMGAAAAAPMATSSSSAISPSAIPEPLTSAPTPPVLSPLSPLRSPAALGPDSAYARFRARARAKTLASSLPTSLEPVAAAGTTDAQESLAETIAAIREAEEWDWPIPPLVHRPSPPSLSPRSGSPLHSPLEFELGGFAAFATLLADNGKVEELRSINGASPKAQSRSVDDNHYHVHHTHHIHHSQHHHAHHTDERDYFVHPFAAARYTSSLDSHGPTPRRGSDASVGLQHSGSSFASEHGPVTPDDYENPFEHPHLHMLRGGAGPIKVSAADRVARRYGVPF